MARLVWDYGYPACEGGNELQESTNLLDWQTVDMSTLPEVFFPYNGVYTREYTLTPPAGVPVFYRRVTILDGISVESPPVAVEVLPHASPPLSPPSHFDAIFWNDITLRWCPNPAAEQVTGYRIFRSTVPGGPYERVMFTGDNTTADGDIVSTVYSFDDLGSNETPSVTLTPASVRYYYVVAAVSNGVVSALSPENGAGNSDFYGYFDPDSFHNPTGWLSTTPSNDELLKYCDDDYVGNRPWSSPTSNVVQEEVACFDEPGIIKPSRPFNEEPAPYKMIGGSGGVSYHMTYYHLDHLGSPRILTDSNGARIQGQHFLPFGEEMPVEAGVNTRKFTGHERDAETGLDYMLARYYSSSLGRFLSVDPTKASVIRADPQTWNRYTYAMNNPLSFVDHDGRYSSWGPGFTHTDIINRAFPGLTKDQRKVLVAASKAVDRDQSPGGAYKHAMRSPGQSVEQAKKMTHDFIKTNEQMAQAQQADYNAKGGKGLSNEALSAFGTAGHAVADNVSPSHTGTQLWSGTSGTRNVVTGVEHAAAEFDPSDENCDEAVAATQEAFKETFGDEAAKAATTAPTSSGSAGGGVSGRRASGDRGHRMAICIDGVCN